MSALPEKKKYTSEEYLSLEEKAKFRSEYEDGKIVAMAGGSFNHTQIKFNVAKALDFQEYILVSQDKAAVEQFIRQAHGSWRYLVVVSEESVLRLMTVEAELNLKEVYQAVDFESEENL